MPALRTRNIPLTRKPDREVDGWAVFDIQGDPFEVLEKVLGKLNPDYRDEARDRRFLEVMAAREK